MIDKKIRRLILLFCFFNIVIVIVPLGFSINEKRQSLIEFQTKSNWDYPQIEYLSQMEALRFIDEIVFDNKLIISKFNQGLKYENYIISNLLEIEIEGNQENTFEFIKKLEEMPMVIIEKIYFVEDRNKCRLEFRIPGVAYEK